MKLNRIGIKFIENGDGFNENCRINSISVGLKVALLSYYVEMA